MEILSAITGYLSLTVFAFFISSGLLLLTGHKSKTSSSLLALILYTLLLSLAYLTTLYLPEPVSINVLLFAFVAGLPLLNMNKAWNIYGRLSFVLLIQATLAFVVFVSWNAVVLSADNYILSFSIATSLLIFAAMLLAIVQAFELIDVICRIKWERLASHEPNLDYFPKVSLHVPAYNEPPEMVIATLNALSRLDYPNYEVIMIDDNTEDESLWKPVERYCKKQGFKFYHLENWPGYKSGALNFATTKTDEAAEIIGIIDADYIVEPNYLKDLVGQFKNKNMAFVQTPQDYRDFDQNDRYLKALYNAYQYFFKLSMASRNERNGIIFTGTMGLIRKNVLEEVGGWDEWCITEDAEIAVKILDKGYDSIFIDRTYGRGLMPLDFESLKKQRFRWAFGGMQVLRLHWKKLLPWPITPGSKLSWSKTSATDEAKLSLGQKADFWMGGLQWLNDPITFLFTLFLLANSIIYFFTSQQLMNHIVGIGLFVPFVLILTNLARTLWGLKLRLNISYIEAFYTLLMLLSLTWVVSKACLLGLTQKSGVFLRTPKQKSKYGLLKVVQIVNREIAIVFVCLVAITALVFDGELSSISLVLVVLLMWQSFIYASAVIASYWSYRSSAQLSNQQALEDSELETTGVRVDA